MEPSQQEPLTSDLLLQMKVSDLAKELGKLKQTVTELRREVEELKRQR